MNGPMTPALPVTLESLAERPIWVAWAPGRRGPGETVTKVPYSPQGGKAHADDPATWGTRAAAEACAARLPKPYGAGGVGLELTDLGNGLTLGGIDLDTCRTDDGTLAPWASEVVERFATYTEISPSGTGVKLFLAFDAVNLTSFRTAMGTPHGKSWKNGTGKHPPAIELHLGNRYFAVTGIHLAGTPTELAQVPPETILWLIREAGPRFAGTAKTIATGLKNPAELEGDLAGRIEAKATLWPSLARRWRGDWDGLADQSRSGRAFSLGAILRIAGFNRDDIVDALQLHPDTSEWAATATQRDFDRIYDRAGEAKRKESHRGRLFINAADLPKTAVELRDHLAKLPEVFDRGVPVRLGHDHRAGGLVAYPLNVDGVVRLTHSVVQPWKFVKAGDGLEPVNMTLPERVARLYLDMRAEWNLRPLNGIACAPLLRAGGAIAEAEGYDPGTGMYSEKVPDMSWLPVRPTEADAAAALLVLREQFKTFPFADAHMVNVSGSAVPVVDTSRPPGADESAFLAGLLTAICRPSLPLAPGLLLRAAPMSGAGAGKGLLARCICAVAFGRPPHAVTGGATPEELEKRIASELIAGGPVLFLDNLNAQAFRSDLLASAITERPARVRILGKSEMVPLNATAFVVLTGNGLSVSEDLARRFLTTELDPRSEDPEARPFDGDILAEVMTQRPALLAAALTIWRWGQIRPQSGGRPMGSFIEWSTWVRDPLLGLGCIDPAARVSEAKARDTRRQAVADLFNAWWEHHHDMPVPASRLHDDVKAIADPQGRGRQFLSAHLEKLAGTRMAGFVLSRQAAPGQWGAATFRLQKSDVTPEGHRDRKGA